MKKTTVYKVVRYHLGAWRSYCYSRPLALTYDLNVRTTAPRGTVGILVFDTLTAARAFLVTYRANRGPARIFECDGYGTPYPLGVLSSVRYIFRHFRRLGAIEKVRTQDFCYQAPSGTLAVSSVIPRRVVT